MCVHVCVCARSQVHVVGRMESQEKVIFKNPVSLLKGARADQQALSHG